MITTIKEHKICERDGFNTLSITIEQEMTKPEVTQRIAQMLYNISNVESQIIANPDNADMKKQKEDMDKEIAVYLKFRDEFPN